MKKINYQPKQVRIFLILLLLFIEVFTYKYTGQNSGDGRVIFLSLPAILIAILLIIPRIFFPVFKVILIGSGYLGQFIFAVIAIVVFIFILAPLSLALKLFGKQFMHPDVDSSLSTYYDESEINQYIDKQF